MPPRFQQDRHSNREQSLALQRVSLISMSIEVSEEDVERLVTAIEHYDAYLHSQNREDTLSGACRRAATGP
jgi:hypothetical protein